MSEIVLGVRLQPSQFQRIKLENIALTNNVESLKAEAAQKINVESDNIGIYNFVVMFPNNDQMFY